MVARLSAGRGAPAVLAAARTTWAPTCPRSIPLIRTVTCPYTGETLATVPALNPDVTIVHAQRADAEGNTQIWGLLGVQKEAAFASSRVIVVVEEMVGRVGHPGRPEPHPHSRADRRRGGGRALGRHPSYAQGYYDRDNDFYVGWETISRDPGALAPLPRRVRPRRARPRGVRGEVRRAGAARGRGSGCARG